MDSDSRSGDWDTDKWDMEAERYSKFPIPSPDHDGFLNLLKRAYSGKRDLVLDIGCGDGQYSIALSKEFSRVMGMDISPVMIEHARNLAAEEGRKEVEFHVRDWSTCSIEEIVGHGMFDLVFAHMTPAINGTDAVERMVTVCDGMCFVVFPTRIKDDVDDKMYELTNVEPYGFDGTVPTVFSAVWAMGYSPRVEYWTERWDNERKSDDIMSTYAWGMSDPTILEKISEYLDSVAVEGVVKSDTTVQSVCIYWKV